MSLAELRDLFIVIYAVAGIAVGVFISILIFLVFRRIRSILDLGRATAGKVQDMTSLVSENIVGPLVGIASFLQGVRKALEFISGSSRRKEGKRSG